MYNYIIHSCHKSVAQALINQKQSFNYVYKDPIDGSPTINCLSSLKPDQMRVLLGQRPLFIYFSLPNEKAQNIQSS